MWPDLHFKRPAFSEQKETVLPLGADWLRTERRTKARDPREQQSLRLWGRNISNALHPSECNVIPQCFTKGSEEYQPQRLE